MVEGLRWSVEEIQARADAIQWFHAWPLVPGVNIKGMSPMLERAHYFQIPEDLSGKRVLDIGCAEGFFTFLAESRGAEVVAIDCWPREGFFLAHEVLNSKVEFHQMSIYDLRPEDLGLFDIVFFFGVYYHLKNPILALERIASMTREWALVESQIMVLPARAPALDLTRLWRRLRHQPPPAIPEPEDALSRFLEHDEFNRDPTNWWIPNTSCLLQTIRAAGFPRAELVCRYDGSRAIVRATKGPRTAVNPLAEDIFVAIDVPGDNAMISGPLEIEGLAMSQLHPEDGIHGVRVYLDRLDDPGCELGEAEYGLSRPDQALPFGRRYGACGYRFRWEPSGVEAGPHTLHVLVEGKLGWNYRSVPVVVS